MDGNDRRTGSGRRPAPHAFGQPSPVGPAHHPTRVILNQNLHGAGVYSVYLNPADFALLRKHQVPMAIADSPLRDVAWYALDALVNKLVLKKSDWAVDPSIHPLPYALITPQNVPSTDAYPYPDFAPFFEARWKASGITLKS